MRRRIGLSAMHLLLATLKRVSHIEQANWSLSLSYFNLFAIYSFMAAVFLPTVINRKE